MQPHTVARQFRIRTGFHLIPIVGIAWYREI